MTVVDRLSPSKISTFRRCPQNFAFRYVEGLEEPEDPYMLRGTLVHRVCELIFDLPAGQRSRAAAVGLLHRVWELMVDEEPALAELFVDHVAATAWLASAEDLLTTWFRLESPDAIDVAGRELFVEIPRDEVVLAGIIDRLDRLPDGTWAITDYKTGRAPGRAWELSAFFQLRFYALVASAHLGIEVTKLRLVHLAGAGEVLELACDEVDLRGVSGQVDGLASVMRASLVANRWGANVGRQCDWCSFKVQCPAWASQD